MYTVALVCTRMLSYPFADLHVVESVARVPTYASAYILAPTDSRPISGVFICRSQTLVATIQSHHATQLLSLQSIRQWPKNTSQHSLSAHIRGTGLMVFRAYAIICFTVDHIDSCNCSIIPYYSTGLSCIRHICFLSLFIISFPVLPNYIFSRNTRSSKERLLVSGSHMLMISV